MRSCVTSCKPREVSVVPLVSCRSITFAVWFLVAVVEDDMHLPAKRSWALNKSSPQAGLAILNRHFQPAPVWLVRIDSGRGGPGPQKIVWSILGVLPAATTKGGAPRLSRIFERGISWAGCGEYIGGSGRLGENSVNPNVRPRKLGVFHLAPDFSAGKVLPAGRSFVGSGHWHQTRRSIRHLTHRPGPTAGRRCRRFLSRGDGG